MTKYLKSFLSILFLFVFNSFVFAQHISASDVEVDIFSSPAQFAQQSDWINADSCFDFAQMVNMSYTDTNADFSSYQANLDMVDYVPATDISLIESDSLKDIISVKSENEVNITVKYHDKYGLGVSAGYPKLYYRKQNTTDAFTPVSLVSAGGNKYGAVIPADYGAYEYYVTAANEIYPGEYSTENNKKVFVVTERPYDFVNLNPNLQNDNAASNAAVNFSWNINKGVNTDILKNTLFLGKSENSMQQYDLGTQTSFTAQNLSPRTRYYWRVEVENQYGAKLLSPQTFQFVTLGEITKAYNAPNPFNPQKGQKTRIFFEMAENGKADIDIYSEYGDKIFNVSLNGLNAGNNEYAYDGRDDYKNILYNGTYLCVIKKKYSGRTSTEKCRLLIIK